MIPKIMRELAKIEKCPDEVAAFESCCKTNSLLMIVKCRQQNDTLKSCLELAYTDEPFIKKCTGIYLNQRSEYRRTGITKKQRDYMAKTNNISSGNVI